MGFQFYFRGNWGVDLAAGSDYGYKLLFVVLLAGLFAVFLQVCIGRSILPRIADFAFQDISQPPWMRHRTRFVLRDNKPILVVHIILSHLQTWPRIVDCYSTTDRSTKYYIVGLCITRFTSFPRSPSSVRILLSSLGLP
jgi:hypothetical protein